MTEQPLKQNPIATDRPQPSEASKSQELSCLPEYISADLLQSIFRRKHVCELPPDRDLPAVDGGVLAPALLDEMGEAAVSTNAMRPVPMCSGRAEARTQAEARAQA